MTAKIRFQAGGRFLVLTDSWDEQTHIQSQEIKTLDNIKMPDTEREYTGGTRCGTPC